MRLLLIIMILCFTVPSAFAQGVKGAKAAAGKPVPDRIVKSETDEYRELRLSGFDALYNMDYQTAKAKFVRMTQLLPDYPAGYFYLATAYWLDLLNSSRRLQSNLYSSDSFYADTKEKVDEQVDKEFRRLVTAALDRAESAAKKNPHDAEAVYYQGAAHG